MIRSLIIFLFLLSANVSAAQKHVVADTGVVEKRMFSNEAIKKLKADKEFQYDRFQEPPASLWDRFWSWVWYQIMQLLSTERGRNTTWAIGILIALAVLTFFIMKVLGMKEGGLFGRRNQTGTDYTISSDDIHGISFENAIQQAISSSNYRLAIRLLYLQSLKKLSDNGYINWQLNKTNTDYLHETSDKKWHSLFTSLTVNFEYIWYGETQVDKERFNSVQQQFIQFNNQL